MRGKKKKEKENDEKMMILMMIVMKLRLHIRTYVLYIRATHSKITYR